MTHWVYVLRCGDQSLYTGYTTDVARRVATHQVGRGARYTRGRGTLVLVAAWGYADKRAALRAEARFKRLKRPQKLAWLGDNAGPP